MRDLASGRFTTEATASPWPTLNIPITWHSPNGQVHYQNDFILVLQCFKSKFNKVKTRTFSGADIGSNHDLMTTFKLKLKTKHCPKSPKICFDYEKKDPEVTEVFQAQVRSKFAALNLLEIRSSEAPDKKQ